MMRTMLYEAAQAMMRSKKWSWLKAWPMQIARRRGMKKAIVALARRLAVIMHRIWVDSTEFRTQKGLPRACSGHQTKCARQHSSLDTTALQNINTLRQAPPALTKWKLQIARANLLG